MNVKNTQALPPSEALEEQSDQSLHCLHLLEAFLHNKLDNSNILGILLLQIYCLCKYKQKWHLLGLLLKGSEASGTISDPPVAPVIVRLSRLDNESLYDDVAYEPLRALFGVAATRTEKYFSCSMLEVVSPLEVPGNIIISCKN